MKSLHGLLPQNPSILGVNFRRLLSCLDHELSPASVAKIGDEKALPPMSPASLSVRQRISPVRLLSFTKLAPACT